MAPPTVAIIANPVSGRDVRRLLANAARSSIADKVTIVRRVAIGAVQAGAGRLLVLPDPHGICRRALSTLELDVDVEQVVVPRTHDERETIAAARWVRDAGADAVVTIGGDGTNRVFSIGWPDAPLVALSTGTNNVFPVQVEPTIAGAAAGLVASGALTLAAVARRAKAVGVEPGGQEPDIALVDAVLTSERVVGSRVPYAPDLLRLAVLAVAEPAAVGISPVGGLLDPVSPADDAALVVRFGAGRTVTAPISPGLYADVPVAGWERIALGEVVEATGPGLLAFDGDRRRVVDDGVPVRFCVQRSGPMVIDVHAAMTAAATDGLYVRA